MKLLDEHEISRFAYEECYKGNDTPEMRNLITSPYWSFAYCIDIKDIPEMYIKIKNPVFARWYCEDMKDRPEVRKYIK